MERVLGIGGYFMRAADPAALSAWYRDCLGLDADANGLWHQEAGPTVLATFEFGTDYFGSRAQQSMLNFRVRDLDAMLAQLRAKERTWPKKRKTWRVSVGSAGSPIPRAIGSSCGSLPDHVVTRAVACRWARSYVRNATPPQAEPALCWRRGGFSSPLPV